MTSIDLASGADRSGDATRPPDRFYDHDDSTNRCILCADPNFRLHREVTRYGFTFRFSRCHCGLIKQTPMPNESFFEWFFNSELFLSAKESGSDEIWGFYDYLKDEPCRLATSRYRYWRFRRIFESAGSSDVMKIGPATGSMLYVLNEHGHDAIGCDVSDRFVAYAHENYGVRIDEGRFEYLGYEDDAFDVVMLFNVIENVPNLDEFLASISRRVRPDGHFILNHVEMSGNLVERFQGEGYFLYRPPVCYMFEQDALGRLLDEHGFQIETEYRDIRVMHLEKILTLLGWNRSARVASLLRLHRIRFPIYAYPSKVTIARRRSD